MGDTSPRLVNSFFPARLVSATLDGETRVACSFAREFLSAELTIIIVLLATSPYKRTPLNAGSKVRNGRDHCRCDACQFIRRGAANLAEDPNYFCPRRADPAVKS